MPPSFGWEKTEPELIKLDDRETEALEFKALLNDSDRGERWYLENYAAH